MHLFGFALLLLLSVSTFAGEIVEPKPGSTTRTAIMEAMRFPISEHIGQRVTFTGRVKVLDRWAIFQGHAAPSDGKSAKPEVADELELDLFVLLRLDRGKWIAISWGFAGDISAMEEAKEGFPKAPRRLFESISE